jgi:hypothetical protein
MRERRTGLFEEEAVLAHLDRACLPTGDGPARSMRPSTP